MNGLHFTGRQFENSLDYLQWHYIAGAVLKVFIENREREEVIGIKASADVWATYSTFRTQIWNRARRHWCEKTGLDDTWFPYSEDAVARLYFRFRKRNDEEIAAFAAEIGS